MIKLNYHLIGTSSKSQWEKELVSIVSKEITPLYPPLREGGIKKGRSFKARTEAATRLSSLLPAKYEPSSLV